MADTITILDGLQFEQTANSDVYTIDVAGAAGEAVKTYAVILPDTASYARVIFNNQYDAAGSQAIVRVKVTKITGVTAGVPTKTENTEVKAWTAIADQGVLESGDIDVSNCFATLHIDCAIAGTTAHDGTEIIVQIRSEGSVNEWTTLTRFIGPNGTGVKSDCSETTAAGETVVGVTNPTTGKLNKTGKFIFIHNTDDVTHSEIAYLTATSGD